MTTESSSESGGFWRTLPGVIAAFSGLIVAVGGLIAVLNTAGIISAWLPHPPTRIIQDNNNLPYFMTRPLVENDLVGKSSYDLELMRNEIFARHGYIFARSDLRTYFGQQAWYIPKFSKEQFDYGSLTAVQVRNVSLISEFEKKPKP
jgi:hypothetical protein